MVRFFKIRYHPLHILILILDSTLILLVGTDILVDYFPTHIGWRNIVIRLGQVCDRVCAVTTQSEYLITRSWLVSGFVSFQRRIDVIVNFAPCRFHSYRSQIGSLFVRVLSSLLSVWSSGLECEKVNLCSCVFGVWSSQCEDWKSAFEFFNH